MTLLTEIKADSLQARKDKSRGSKLLVTLFAEAQMFGKNNGNREPTDEEVVKIVRKFQKGAMDSATALTHHGRDNTSEFDDLQFECQFLEKYLPKMLNDEETKIAVQEAKDEVNFESPKDMGAVIGLLKEKHGANIDMKLASSLIRSAD